MLFDHAESEARAARRGLCSDADPIPPWEWRKIDLAKRYCNTCHVPYREEKLKFSVKKSSHQNVLQIIDLEIFIF